MISALANISNGGNVSVLLEDLNRYSSVLANNLFDKIINITAAPATAAPYQDGVMIDWGTDGIGITSACVYFGVDLLGASSTYHSNFAVNLTSEVYVNGTFSPLNGTTKQVDLTFNIRNEWQAALAKNFTVYFETDGLLTTEEWQQVAAVSTVDYGNGTYTSAFTIETVNVDDPVLISLKCTDLRDIFVQANVTCTQI